MKIFHIAVMALASSLTFLPPASFAEAMATPFPTDGCVPGYTEDGRFVDENGKILDSAGWVATADHKVLTAAGQQVFLKKSCLGLLGAGQHGSLILAGVGVLALGLAAGGSSSTNATTGTN